MVGCVGSRRCLINDPLILNTQQQYSRSSADENRFRHARLENGDGTRSGMP